MMIKTIGDFEVKVSEKNGRINVTYKNSEIEITGWKEYSYHPNAVNEFNNINTIHDVRKFFEDAHVHCTPQIIMKQRGL